MLLARQQALDVQSRELGQRFGRWLDVGAALGVDLDDAGAIAAVAAMEVLGGNEAQASRTPADFGEFARASGRTALERSIQAGVKVD